MADSNPTLLVLPVRDADISAALAAVQSLAVPTDDVAGFAAGMTVKSSFCGTGCSYKKKSNGLYDVSCSDNDA